MPDLPDDAIIANLSSTLRDAPELATAPGLALPASQTPDPSGTGQAIAQSANTLALHNAVQSIHHSSPSIFSSVFHGISHYVGDGFHALGTGVGDVLHVANKPLQAVQHEYRYLHDVEAQHGFLAALTESLGIIGAGAAIGVGTALAPVTGGGSLAIGAGIAAGVLGSEATAAGLGHITHQDSWARTANGNTYRDPHTGQPVSIGRDFASLIGQKPGTGTYKFVSGLSDGLSDLALDPLARAGGLATAVRTARTIVPGAGRIISGEELLKVVDRNTGIQRAFDGMARDDALTIAERHPNFAPLAVQLGQATTRDEVTQVFRNALNQNQLRNRALPTLDLTAVPVAAMRSFFRNTNIPGLAAIGRGQTLLAQVISEGGQTISNITMPLEGTARDLSQAAVGFHRWLRANGVSEADAHTMANDMLNAPDIATRRNLWANGEILALKARSVRAGLSPQAAALLRDEDIQRQLGEQFKTVHGANVGREVAYGAAPRDLELPLRVNPDGSSQTGGVLLSQRGSHTLISLTDMRKAAEAMANAHTLYANAKSLAHRVDDFTWNHFTGSYFRRFVLLTGSFAGHVAFSEALLNSLRQGTLNLLASRAASTLGKLSTKYGGDDALNEALTDPEVSRSIGAYMGHMLASSRKRAGRYSLKLAPGWAVDSELAHSAALLALTNDGHIVPGALSADHEDNTGLGGTTETKLETGLRAIINRRRHWLRSTGDWTVYGPGDDTYGEQTRAWGTWLKNIAEDQPSAAAAKAYKAALDQGHTVDQAHELGAAAATAHLRTLDPDFLAGYDASRVTRQGWEHMDPLEAWGHEIMLNVRGATTGTNGTIHHDLLDALTGPRKITTVNGKPAISTPALEPITQAHLKAILDKPIQTVGRRMVPVQNYSLERISQAGYSMIGRFINFVSREPSYLTAFHKYRMQLWPAVQSGHLSEEDAITRAQTWATEEVIKFVHNTHEKTVLSEAVHNLAPFWFAQQQAYKRVGRLLVTDPQAFRRYQLLVTQLHDTVTQTKDKGGSPYITFPGTGFLGAGVPELLGSIGIPVTGSSPVAFAGTLDSLSYVAPGVAGLGGLKPDIGPAAAIPVKALAQHFPELRPAGTLAIGNVAMNTNIWSQLIPNAMVNRFLQAVRTDSRGFQSAWLATMQTLAYEQNVALDHWNANGQKGPKPNITPDPTASPQARQAFIDKVKNQTRINFFVRALLGMTPIPLSPQIQVQDFGFRQELTTLIHQEGSVTAGVSAFLKLHPDATPYTVFQSDQPAGTALPASRQAEAWVAAHNDIVQSADYGMAAPWFLPQLTDTKYDSSVYNEQIAQHLRERRTPLDFYKALYIANGDTQYYSLDRPAYEKALKSGNYDPAALRRAFSTYTNELMAANPLWADDFQSKDRLDRRTQTLAQTDALIASGRAPQGYMLDGLKSIMDSYHTYNSALAQTSGSKAKATLADSYQTYLIHVADTNPELKPFIFSVLGPVTSIRGASFSQAEAAAQGQVA